MVDREELAGRVQAEVDSLDSRLSGLDDGVFDRPLHDGSWTFRDLLSHMLFWQEECLWAFRSTREGTYERRDYSDTNAINAAAVERFADVTGSEIARRFIASGREISEAIREIPEQLWMEKPRLAAWVNGTVLEHIEDHRADLDAALSGE